MYHMIQYTMKDKLKSLDHMHIGQTTIYVPKSVILCYISSLIYGNCIYLHNISCVSNFKDQIDQQKTHLKINLIACDD
jgi:hypothetical protein